jgi:hypothetical protein
MNKEQLNLAWETSSHYERNEFIKNWSVGSIDNSDTVGIELFKVGDEILAMDHEDINEPQPFLDIFQVAYFYEWNNDELLDQINEYKDGITKTTLRKIQAILLNK